MDTSPWDEEDTEEEKEEVLQFIFPRIAPYFVTKATWGHHGPRFGKKDVFRTDKRL